MNEEDFQKSFEELHKKEADLELLCYDCHRIKSNNFTSKNRRLKCKKV